MKRYLKYTVAVAALALTLAACQTGPKVAGPVGMTKYGYPDVLGTLTLQPGQSGKITVPDQFTTGKAAGYMTISIPGNAFSVPVRFQVLAGTNSSWDSMVSPGQMVVANFAYRVINEKTGGLIEKFNAPITYSVTDSMITQNSIYWATTAAKPAKLINANAASSISGTTLSHPTPVASVGWIVTTPRSDLKGMTKKASGM